ncbi:MAG: nucleotidyltransferase family protein [Planctomycetota bacterium]|jgi:predicted nucleotidyltransferase
MKMVRDKSAAPGVRKVSLREIRRLVDQIVECCSPRKVILFGSHARHRAGTDSDVDLLVVTDRGVDPDASLRIRRSTHYEFPLDIIVCPADRLAERVTAGDFFLAEVVATGKVLYERLGR